MPELATPTSKKDKRSFDSNFPWRDKDYSNGSNSHGSSNSRTGGGMTKDDYLAFLGKAEEG